jgi:hypothetical protein
MGAVGLSPLAARSALQPPGQRHRGVLAEEAQALLSASSPACNGVNK